MAPPPPPPPPEPVFFAGTVVQPLGFDRVAARYARLRGIRVLGLAGARIAQLEPEERDAQPATHAATTDLPTLCAAITDLDLSRNLFASLGAALAPARALRGLRTLTLDGNRMRVEDAALAPLGNVTGLGLSGAWGWFFLLFFPSPRANATPETLLTPAETSAALAAFPQLERLALRGNALRGAAHLRLPPTLRSLDLGGNALEALSELAGLRAQCPQLRSLNLRGNRIASARGAAALPAALDDLDVSQNAIVAWDFVTRLADDGPPIRHLRIAGNPLYDGADAEGGDTRALVIARLPCLRVLNHSAIAPAERLRAELHYLQHVGAAVAAAGPGVLAAHPRYGALCVAHGAPVAAAAAAKHDLAARLVRVRFVLAGGALVGVRRREWTRELPRGDSVYQVLGVVGEGVGRVPVGLRLVVEGGGGGGGDEGGDEDVGEFCRGGGGEGEGGGLLSHYSVD